MVKTERPSNWTSIREHVLRRDNFTCTFCGVKNVNFEVDHILALSNGGNNNYRNLRTLCRDCHVFKTKKESSRGYKLPIEKPVVKEKPTITKVVYNPDYKKKKKKKNKGSSPSKLTKFLWWPFV